MFQSVKDNLMVYSVLDILDNALKMFVDNKISLDDLKRINRHYALGMDKKLFSTEEPMNIPDIKRYYAHTKYQYTFNEDNVITEVIEVFNRNYFNYLVKISKKSKAYTEALIRYVGKLDHVPLTFLAMEKVKLRNLNYFLVQPKLANFLTTHDNVKTLADFYVYLLTMNQKLSLPYFNLLKKFMAKKDGFNMDITLPFVTFGFAIEACLHNLPAKIKNTIKVKFLILNESYLAEDEYDQNNLSGKMVVNNYAKKFSKKFVNSIFKYYQEHEDILDRFNDNGYNAFYYSFLEEVK